MKESFPDKAELSAKRERMNKVDKIISKKKKNEEQGKKQDEVLDSTVNSKNPYFYRNPQFMPEQITHHIFYNLIDDNGTNSLMIEILLPKGAIFKHTAFQSTYIMEKYRYDRKERQLIVDSCIIKSHFNLEEGRKDALYNSEFSN